MKRRVIKKVNIFFERVLHIFYAAFSVLSRKSKREQVRLERMAAREEAEQKKIIERIEEEKESVFRKKEAIERQLEAEARAEATELDKQIAQFQRSTKTSFKKLAPIHNYLRTKSKLYYVWHLNPYSSSLHFGALLFFVATSVYFLKAIYPAMYQKALADSLTCTWNDSVSSDWDNASNWTNCNSGVPSATDYVSFSGSATGKNSLVMTSNKTVAKVESLSANSSTYTFNTNYYNLIVNGNFTWQAGTLTFGGNSEVTVSGDFEISAGTFNYNSSTLILSGNFDTTLNITKDLYNLNINKTNSSNSVTLSQATSTVRNSFVLQKGTLNSNKLQLTQAGCAKIS